MIIHKTGIFRISCLSAVLVLVSCGDTEHKVDKLKEESRITFIDRIRFAIQHLTKN